MLFGMEKSCRSSASRTSRSRGFSLIEVLVSIIVLSFGLLGMVGLQASALQANREAKSQTAAVTLARELAEMMRGNKDVGIASTGNPYFGDFTSPLAPAAASYCLSVASSSPCTSISVAANARWIAVANAQMTDWLARVEAELPAPHVVICFDNTPFDAAGLPQWGCSNTGDTAYVKIGWTRGSTNRSATAAAALERATAPTVVLPVIAGNTL